MLFIKYAPKFLRNLLWVVYILVFAFTFWIMADYDGGLRFVGWFFFISVYAVLNALLFFAFKPIVEKYNSTLYIPYVLDLSMLIFIIVVSVFNL